MSLNGKDRPDVRKVLDGLKDFQRETVNYVFRRLYLDEDLVSRFLIADEVGLGKTLVARGVIAKAVDHLWDAVERIDVVYICSNQDIAQQNIDRLNITSERKFQHASRATLLPIKIQGLRENKLNFVSLTPGTSFNLSSQTGWAWERVVLFHLLLDAWKISEATLSNVLRADVKVENWRYQIDYFQRNETLDNELKLAFLELLRVQPDLHTRFEHLASEIGSRRRHLSNHLRWERNLVIRDLRRLLARSSLSALEPDLVILDEFQRFKYLLDPDNEFALLAQELFNFRDSLGHKAKVLLLSATPYKMYTLQAEQDEDHYTDFRHTVNFLLNGRENESGSLEQAIQQYRKGLFHFGYSGVNRQDLQRVKTNIEGILRKVMVRTERLAATEDRNGMVAERFSAFDRVEPRDLGTFVTLDRISSLLDAGDQVEYWKSSVYQLNLMEDYKFKQKFDAACKKRDIGLAGLLKQALPYLMKWSDIQTYMEVDPGNARLRALMELTIESGNWRLLWMPPALSYYRPEGTIGHVDSKGSTKTLIFSAWRVVPKAISVLLSYAAERRILREREIDFNYSELTRRRRSLLNFTYTNERLTGMPVFCLIYPCLTLATKVDPMIVARDMYEGDLPSVFYVLQKTSKILIRKLLDKAISSISIPSEGPEDERWYWAALALLDRYYNRPIVEEWLSTLESKNNWSNMLEPGQGEEDSESRFAEHVEEFKAFFQNPTRLQLGRLPSDLEEVIGMIAIAGPAVSSLRAMLRVTAQAEGLPEFLAAGAQSGLGFRTLFNQPDTISLLQELFPKEVYWKAVLHYCVEGNLQAVMDEFMHVLHESLGLFGHEAGESAIKMGHKVKQALSIRSPSLKFDEISIGQETDDISIEEHRIRCRYALRFGNEKSDDISGVTRDEDVRVAFNSPFRPFVLSTTSIGQEGLDFHQYCHRVVHWNLPSNPVDLEQREGRVHRYKGHVIRRNLAARYGFSSIKQSKNGILDPWKSIFDQAVKDRQEGSNDLIPYWISEDGEFSIERHLPMLPLSREVSHLSRLKKSLVAYRSVIGQPRQSELLEFLSDQLSEEELLTLTQELCIDLSPPRITK